ncbi:MAG: tetratricopeptide repeat protein [Rhodobacteraceae bacterium]|nr:tetratricopeptide repeat protein [Paracoccaceae bacterium]
MLAGCAELTDEEKNADLGPLNVIDATGLNDIMLNLADPAEAVAFFRDSLAADPERVDLKKSYAQALVQNRQYAEAALIYEQLIEDGQADGDDRLNYAGALVRNGAWEEARVQLNAIPPTVETFDRYFLEALVADQNQEWEKADNFYDIARGLTTRPAQVLNNWGISKLERDQYSAAEKLFKQAISADSKMFTAKNNLVITLGKQEVYRLPVIPMNDKERAILLYNLAREAIRNGDVDIARGLLADSINVHPQYFQPAVALLASL